MRRTVDPPLVAHETTRKAREDCTAAVIAARIAWSLRYTVVSPVAAAQLCASTGRATADQVDAAFDVADATVNDVASGDAAFLSPPPPLAAAAGSRRPAPPSGASQPQPHPQLQSPDDSSPSPAAGGATPSSADRLLPRPPATARPRRPPLAEAEPGDIAFVCRVSL